MSNDETKDLSKKEEDKSSKNKRTSNPIILAKEYLNDNYDFRFNTISLDYEISIKGQNKFELLNEDKIFCELQENNYKVSIASILSIVRGSGISKDYNPILEYLEKLPKWDGTTDHISNLANYVKAVDQKGFNLHFKKHLVRTIKCALDKNFYNKQAFIIRKDEQNDGKTEFIRFLCPPELKNYMAENISTDKDSRILLAKNLIINLDELDTLGKSDINTLKAFFSKDKINERLPYDRKNSNITRIASFFGSTNRGEFLNDETGSVRWLIFDITEINFNYNNHVTGVKEININDVYAQAYSLYKENFQCTLTREEVIENEKRNRKFQVMYKELELVQKFFRPDEDKKDENFMAVADIEIHISNYLPGSKLSFEKLGKAMKALNYERYTKYDNRRQQSRYGYYVIKAFPDLEPTLPTRNMQNIKDTCPY